MKTKIFYTIHSTLWILFLVLFLFPNTAFSNDKQIIGLIEKVVICPENLPFKAKVDTGAQTSSLDVSKLKAFKKNGKQWVRFEVVNFLGQRKVFEKQVSRIVKIKRHRQASATRFVVKLGICLGPRHDEIEFTLADRTGFSYKMLIGRNCITGRFVVDPSQRYLLDSKCAGIDTGDTRKPPAKTKTN